jgi:uncharacterized membrane protein
MTTRARRIPSTHPVNMKLYDEAPLGVRIADWVTGFMGSWRFIVIQTVIVIIWIVGNVYLIFNFDPYPFILLNLAFSTQAAYAAPLILLAGNRSAARDRATLEHTASETDKEDRQNREILAGISRLEEANHELLERIVGLEGTILENQQTVLDKLPGLKVTLAGADAGLTTGAEATRSSEGSHGLEPPPSEPKTS